MASSSSEDSASDGGEEDATAGVAPLFTRAHTTALLASWLKLHYPRDVLMPAARGKKKPLHTFAGRA